MKSAIALRQTTACRSLPTHGAAHIHSATSATSATAATAPSSAVADDVWRAHSELQALCRFPCLGCLHRGHDCRNSRDQASNRTYPFWTHLQPPQGSIHHRRSVRQAVARQAPQSPEHSPLEALADRRGFRASSSGCDGAASRRTHSSPEQQTPSPPKARSVQVTHALCECYTLRTREFSCFQPQARASVIHSVGMPDRLRLTIRQKSKGFRLMAFTFYSAVLGDPRPNPSGSRARLSARLQVERVSRDSCDLSPRGANRPLRPRKWPIQHRIENPGRQALEQLELGAAAEARAL